MSKAIVFLTHSRADVAWKNRVVASLGGHELRVWDDADDGPDRERLRLLENAMKSAHAAVLLVSESFLASPWIREVQIPVLCQRREKGELRIFPVLVEACGWRSAGWLDGLAMRSLGGEPLAGGSDVQVEEALAALAKDLSTAVEAPEASPSLPDLTPAQIDQFEHLFREYYRPVSSFFARVARRRISKEECHDLTQVTLMRALKGFKNFRHDASVATWLYKIARHVWINRDRDQAAIKRRVLEISLDDVVGVDEGAADVPEKWAEGTPLDPEDGLLRKERVSLVRSALTKLPRQRQRCLFLRLEGLKYREIAELMDISLQSVRSHLHQAREQLRELLGEHFGGLDSGAE